MVKDAGYRSTMGQITKSSTYDIIETIDPIAAAVQHVTSNYVEEIALVAITLHFANKANNDPACSPHQFSYLSSPTTLMEHRRQERAFLYGLVDHLRPLVRKTDGVFLLDYTSYFLLPGRTNKEHELCGAASGKRCSGISTILRSLTPGRCTHTILQSATAPIQYLMSILTSS